MTPELVNNPEAFAKFQAAQGELSGALSRLMVVVENYPQLKSDQNFRDLQAQLEGTENRITVARNRYIQAVQNYNVTVRSFPGNLTAMAFGYKPKPNFTVENEAAISKPPSVEFPAPPAAPARRRMLDIGPASRQAWWRASPRCWRAPMSPCRRSRPASWISRARCRVGRQSHRDPAGGVRGEEGQPNRRADGADDAARRDRAIRHPRGRKWKLGRKGIDDGAILLVAKRRSPCAHRGRLRFGRRAARCNRETHHRRDHHTAFQARRL